jgi:hypothetical protein
MRLSQLLIFARNTAISPSLAEVAGLHSLRWPSRSCLPVFEPRE